MRKAFPILAAAIAVLALGTVINSYSVLPGRVLLPPLEGVSQASSQSSSASAKQCGATVPQCNGECPQYRECTPLMAAGSETVYDCVCLDPDFPFSCKWNEEAAQNQCIGGTCPSGQRCSQVESDTVPDTWECGCIDTAPCGDTLPQCNGTCPEGQSCRSFTDAGSDTPYACECLKEGGPFNPEEP